MTHDPEAFAAILVEQLALGPSVARSLDTQLFDDWAIDSLQAFQLIILIETMAGVAVPPATIPEMYTVGDAYAYYLSLAADRAGRDS